MQQNVELVEKLSHLLSDTVTMKFIAHGYHWNVKGIEFSQMHDFFAEIYEDVDGAIDPLAEDIRKLGYDAPYFLTDFAEMTCLGSQPRLSGDVVQMLESLLNINSAVNACVLEAFEIANASNEQGIANFLAERDDMHKKWNWQLRASLGTFQKMSNYFETVLKPTIQGITADADSGDICPPATQDIGINLQNRQKAIDTAEYGPLNPKEPNKDFWQSKADRWKATIDEAKKSTCGTCVMFIRTPKMLDCIEGGLACRFFLKKIQTNLATNLQRMTMILTPGFAS